ncbi:MAG: ATP-binding cassette domain-containing protein [Aristaeellaceae bacterium]
MLELKGIKKDYPAGDGTVHALKGINLQFRRSEFVSILGPSGCGKTTMLNIIGGLDQYSEGDLVINGTSTKHYKDRDWDSYRNHSIGFVFQSYNLIPHQSVLQNVELALTLSGVSKAERRKRAISVLQAVGLGNQLRKKPAQMSGGQMQRVAIARALVNNPDIILADEPTGALDTETSVQVMDILKEVAKDRLVIMVTHNPELAEKYSTRIIRMLDGEIISDSKPLSAAEAEEMEKQERDARVARQSGAKKERMPSMSLATSFGLSLKNLISKKSRTLLTSFAGSIGIIGIALIFAVSNGMTTYINTVQEDTLSSYPLTLQASQMNMGSLLATFIGNALSGEPHENDAVYEKTMVYDLVNALGSMEETSNDLKSFKAHLEKAMASGDEDGLRSAINGVQYTYDVPLTIYTENVDGTIIHSDSQELTQELMLEYMGMDMSSMMSLTSAYGVDPTSMAGMPMMGGGSSVILWQEMLRGTDGELINPLLEKQYDLIYGSWPNDYNEVVVVVDENNEIADMTLYAMGLKSKDEIGALADAAFNKREVAVSDERWSYQDICGMTFRVIMPASCYTYDEATGTYTDLRDTQAGLRYLYDNGLDLKVVGILRPNEEAVSGMLSGTICYTAELAEYIISEAAKSPVVKAQMENPDTDIFTGLPFAEANGSMSEEEKAAAFMAYIATLSEAEKAATYVELMSIPTQAQIDQIVQQQLSAMTRADIEAMMVQAVGSQVNVSTEDVMKYISAMTDDELYAMIAQMMAEQVGAQYAEQVKAQMSTVDAATLALVLDVSMPATTPEQVSAKAALYAASAAEIPQEQLDLLTQQALSAMTREQLEAAMLPAMAAQMGVSVEMAAPMLAKLSDDELRARMTPAVAEQIKADAAAQLAAMSEQEMCDALEAIQPPFTTAQMAVFHDEVLHFSDTTYEDNLIALGCVDLDSPASINIYASSFEDKDRIEAEIAAYNRSVDEMHQIRYTDYVGLMMSSVTSIINAITYVLIAFVAISLVVSSIMIGVITLISVQERTKEIGILRAIGASKRNVSSMFNAETVIIGFASGALGVGLTWLLCIPINAIIYSLTGIAGLQAVLPWQVALILVGISVVLTSFAGVIPARSAAKKDPVVALRTE